MLYKSFKDSIPRYVKVVVTATVPSERITWFLKKIKLVNMQSYTKAERHVTCVYYEFNNNKITLFIYIDTRRPGQE